MEINLILNGDNNSLNALKLSILYFDRVTVQEHKYLSFDVDEEQKNIYVHGHSLYNDDLHHQLEVLSASDVINIKEIILHEILYPKTNFIKESSEIIFSKSTDIFSGITLGDKSIQFGKDSETKLKEIDEMFDNLTEKQIQDYAKYIDIGQLNIDDMNLVKFSYGINTFIENFSSVFASMADGIPFITNSDFLNSIINELYMNTEQMQAMKNKLKLDCASILLPNLSDATFDDILEIKHEANDELLELRYYIDSLSNNCDIEKAGYFDEIVSQKINPVIRNLEYKMSDMKINVAQKFITEIKNPLSYAPLIGTFFSEVPAHISLLISLGLISTNVGLEYAKQLNNIKKDNMGFLFKLRQKI